MAYFKVIEKCGTVNVVRSCQSKYDYFFINNEPILQKVVSRGEEISLTCSLDPGAKEKRGGLVVARRETVALFMYVMNVSDIMLRIFVDSLI